MNEFWADVARGRWQVQDFQISPDTLAASATSWCGFHRKFLKAHHAGLNMSGTFQLFLGDVGAGWVGELPGDHTDMWEEDSIVIAVCQSWNCTD